MEKLSVFGGTGFIGRHFVAAYPDKCNVIPREENMPSDNDVLYLISTTHNYNVFTDVHLDINTNLNKLMDVLPNVKGTINFISSWFVYGDGHKSYDAAALEGSPCNPRGFYSITKRAAEQLLISYCEINHIHYRVLRLCNVVGGDTGSNKKKNATEYLLQKIIANEPVEVYRGNNYRNYLHVSDVVAAINLVMEKGESDSIYNIGGSGSISLYSLLDYAKSKINSSSVIHTIDPPPFHQFVQTSDFFMDCGKLNQLKFIPKYDRYTIIDKILADHQKVL